MSDEYHRYAIYMTIDSDYDYLWQEMLDPLTGRITETPKPAALKWNTCVHRYVGSYSPNILDLSMFYELVGFSNNKIRVP
jgi:hypothetical protein